MSTLVGTKRVAADGEVSIVRDAAGESRTPQVGDIVLVRITKVDPRTARAKLLTLGETPLRGGFEGLLRVQDVRATQLAEMYRSFRPGDVVRAEILSVTSSLLSCWALLICVPSWEIGGITI